MRLTEVASGLWTMAGPLRFLGVETGARMTVVRLQSGGLLVHSPLPIDDGLAAEIDALGPVVGVAAPSLFHHLSVDAWKARYPDAIYACSPGLDEKRSDIAWDRVLSDEPEPEWADDLSQVFFAARTLESEVVFFHDASRTMICADAIFNLASHPDRLTRAVAFALGNRRAGVTWLEQLLVRDRVGAREQVARMLAHAPRRILLAHGDCVESDGQAVLERAYAWL